MRYRRTKDGLLEVSEIGIGTYALAGVYGKQDPGGLREVLREAYNRGVTMFDTAPVYGDAEELLGEVLRDVRKEVMISTKVPAGLGEVSCSYDAILKACERSIERLGTDYIDLYQIHFDDGVTPVEEVVRAFDTLKAQGKIVTYGIGHVSPERAADYIDRGSVSTVMGELSAVSRNYYLKMLPLLSRSGAGYIGFSLTGRGMLTAVGLTREDLAPGDIRHMDAVFAGERRRSAMRVRDEFKHIGQQIGATAVQTAIAWAIAQEGVLTGLIGPSSMAHLDEDIGAADVEIDPPLRDRLDAFLAEESASLAACLEDEITTIIKTAIPDIKMGAPSLIYAMEGLAELELAREEDLVASVGKVIRIMKGGEGGIAALEAIRKDLLNHVRPT